MILAAIIGVLFYRGAVQHEVNKVLWLFIGVFAFFAGQFIAGFVIGLVSPGLLDDFMTLLVVGLVSGVAAAGIAYWIMLNTAKKNAIQKENEKKNLIDNF